MTPRGTLLCLLILSAPAAAQEPSRAVPPDRASTLKLAAEELSAGRRDEASRLLRSAADRFQSVQALMQLARIQAGAGNASAALESLQQARTIAPNSEDVLSAFVQVSLAARLPFPAITTLDSLTRLCPTASQYHYLLGVALMQAGEMSLAIESLKKANQLDPDHVLTLVALGLALNNRKQYEEARLYLRRGVDLEPDSAEAIAALAEAEEGLGDIAAAEADARRALARSSGDPTANLVLGLVFVKKEQYADARVAFERAIVSSPDAFKAHYQLSLACARLGDTACSQEHLELYKQKLREMEERVHQLRTQTGLGSETRR